MVHSLKTPASAGTRSWNNVTVSRPSIVCKYNIKMGGIDLMDRMISYYWMRPRIKKWTMLMVMHFSQQLATLLQRPCNICWTKDKTHPVPSVPYRSGKDPSGPASQCRCRPIGTIRGRRRFKSRGKTSCDSCPISRSTGGLMPTPQRWLQSVVVLCLQTERSCYSAFHTYCTVH